MTPSPSTPSHATVEARPVHGVITLSVEEHEDLAQTPRGNTTVGVAILTVSDTRTLATDSSGDAVKRHLEDAGHHVVCRSLIPDEAEKIRNSILDAAITEGVDAIILTGGTGLSQRDRTTDVLQSLPGIDVEGFGELFRMLSFETIGPAALLSRATARVVELDNGCRRATFALPGSLNAVETALQELILPTLLHVVWETTR